MNKHHKILAQHYNENGDTVRLETLTGSLGSILKRAANFDETLVRYHVHRWDWINEEMESEDVTDEILWSLATLRRNALIQSREN